MDHNTKTEQPLLPSHTHDNDNDDDYGLRKYPSTSSGTAWLHRRGTLTALLYISLTSIIINLILVYGSLKTVSMNLPRDPAGKSAYTGLSLDTPSIHYHHTDYWSANQTLGDELWENIDTDPMVVALTDEYADSHDLPRSDRFPWDVSKGRYFVKVFHQLHCLKFIRRAFVDYQRGHPVKLHGRHVHHCLDTLRQDVTCAADDTPMPTGNEARAIGDQQPMMCKNFDRLVEWVYAPERNACHRALDDYRSITHSIERYAFCKPGSENYEKMKEYFDKHGHVDPWI